MVAAAPAVPLKDVEWRLDSEPKEFNGKMRARFVPHINARTAAALMDEWVGPLCWSDEYRTVTIAAKEALLCTVSVWDGERWVSKQDVGVPSLTEPQKGGISDAFKRTVTVKWGAGRNVYELPTLWAPCKAVSRDGKTRGYANDDTLPELLRQLKQKGFDADGRLEDGASDENAEGRADSPDRGQTAEVAVPSAPSPRPLGESAAGAGDASQGPAPDASPAVSKARRDKLKSRCVALTADGVSVADAREELKLPLVDSCNEEEIGRFEEMVSDLEEALAAPFLEPVPAEAKS